MKRVLSVASESVPLVKTGGLADVVGALPGALAGQGWEMRVLLPAYRSLRAQVATWPEVFVEDDLFGGRGVVKAGDVDGVAMLLLDAPHLYDREGGPYNVGGADWPDNAQRFAALSWVAAKIARFGLGDGWRPQVLHAHDWQAGLAPAFLKYWGVDLPSVITIHNMAFQGGFDAAVFPRLGLPDRAWAIDGVESYGGVGFLKAGMQSADAITTVSPTYAREICTAEFGCGMEGVMRDRGRDLSGILNGVDYEVWNPEDPTLAKPYNVDNLAGKAACKQALQAEMGLAQTNDGPLFAVVSRLTSQKGMDLLLASLPELLREGGQLAVLGTGDGDLEAGFRYAASANPERVAVHIGYSEPMSHRIMAGADVLLVPSRFEPCGLTQLYALRYGTLPLVRHVGGLADTVVDATPENLRKDRATGFVFADASRHALGQRICEACALYHDKAMWEQVQRRGMSQDFSWNDSAGNYEALYRSLLPA